MAMSQIRRMLMFIGPMLQLKRKKYTFKTSRVGNKERNANNSCPEDVRVLCKQNRLKDALHILHVLERLSDTSTYVCLLQVCIKKKALSEGKLIHAHINGIGFSGDTYLENTLVNMYANCGSLMDARRVFDNMPKQDEFPWSVMIAAYSRNGLAEEALELFHQMQRTCIQANQFTYASVLTGCAKLANFEQGMKIHEEIIQNGFQSDVFVGSALVNMYAKCGNIDKARDVFDKMHQRNAVSWNTMIAGYTQNGYVNEALKLFEEMPKRDVVSWTAMIAGHAQNGQGREALQLFRQMRLTGVKPDPTTFASVLPACANLAALEQGMEIHEGIIRSGIQNDVFVGNALLDMYAKCKSMENAQNLFDKMPQRDTISWNTMIAGYTQNGCIDMALKLFQEIFEPDAVSWTTIIGGYVQIGQGAEALHLFQQMRLAGVKPEPNTFASVLTVCANSAALKQGMEIHEEIFRGGFQSNVFVQSALVDMYAKCGRIEKALEVFDKMQQPNVVSWTAIIAGCVHNGQGVEALQLYRQMKQVGVKPEPNTFASVLPACANLAALEHGMEIHQDILKSGFLPDVFVENALIDMYAKCGSIEKSRAVFDKMHQRSVVSWTVMIAGYAMHGSGKEALELFGQMQHSGVNVDHVTLVCVLSACCHAGLVDEGRRYFNCMSQYYHIIPTMRHYVCMVDLLGRAGLLDEAKDFINKMPIEPDAIVWTCLLGACRTHSNIELGEQVAERLFELDCKNAAPYVLLSNIYAAAGRWDDSENVWKMMKDRRVRKTPGCSWIEVNKQVHAFSGGDRSHPQTEKIYAELERLYRQMKVAGYVPDMRFVLRDVEEEQKEHVLRHHSEKLAIAFGLISTSFGIAIRVIKNLRVCSDCHSAIKFISKIVAREIVVRDASRYHHFKDGWCSCGDYW
eukprot:Gb_10985 [translate_table: standard]